ncbi:MAG: TIM barrel protein [Bacilli bacterium]|nr:TIM barrel protein [Bacilli bacterium]
MINIGICFPGYDYENMSFETLSNYLLQLKKAGITSFDFYTTMFLNNNDKLKQLLIFLNEQDIKISFHYASIKKATSNSIFEQYKEDLIRIRNVLDIHNIKYSITIVFHALPYKNEFNKYEHLQKLAKGFEELSEFAKLLNFEILVETLSNNHPIGNHIGDDLDELMFLATNIKSENFGICWDMGHTRLNNIETKQQLCLPKELLAKVKFTHIHNIKISDDQTIDHIPITNFELQKLELECLIKNNYDGIFSLEYETKNLKENILVYIDNIQKLQALIYEIKKYNLNLA